jgi:hypothetical protein
MSNSLVTMSVYLESLFFEERCSRERETRAAVTREFLTGTSAVRSLNCGSRFRQKLLCQRFAVAVCTDLERADQCRIACESKLCLFIRFIMCQVSKFAHHTIPTLSVYKLKL